jgi:hypothetical protein
MKRRGREGEKEGGAVAVLMIVEEPREVGPTAEGAGWWKSARPKKRGPTPLCCPGYVCIYTNANTQFKRFIILVSESL